MHDCSFRRSFSRVSRAAQKTRTGTEGRSSNVHEESARNSPLFGKAGEAKELIAKVKALEAEAALYQHALDSLRQDMQSFAYSVSHDLRAPLRAIQGFSKILLEDFSSQLEPEALRFLQNVVQNSDHLSSQIDDLLLYYRLGKNPPKKVNVSPRAMVNDLIAEQKALQPGVRISAAVGELPDLAGDPDLMRHVFSQLISNAVKFSRGSAEPRLSVTGKRESGANVYIVEDNGIGFDMAYRDKLFQVFQKLHAEFPGNGIGLALVKKIILAHGGAVWAEGIPDGGARFFISLPHPGGRADPRVLPA